MGWQQWIRTVEIAPAIEAHKAVWAEREVDALLRAGCRVIHVNAPSGSAREAAGTLAPLMHKYDGFVDLHIGGDDFAAYATAGADSVTFDATAVDNVATAIGTLRDSAAQQVGVAFGADVAPEWIATVSVGADLVLCEIAGDAVGRVRSLAALLPRGVTLQVEGDVSQENVRALYLAGAQVLVADNPIFEREDLPRAYRRLVQALA
jgi:pentose-5-phosphate-3-epimerase